MSSGAVQHSASSTSRSGSAHGSERRTPSRVEHPTDSDRDGNGSSSASYSYSYEYDDEDEDGDGGSSCDAGSSNHNSNHGESRHAEERHGDEDNDDSNRPRGRGASHTVRSGSATSPPPDGEAEQESLLSFTTFNLPPQLDGHRLMSTQAFWTFVLVGTNQGAVAAIDPHNTGNSEWGEPSSPASPGNRRGSDGGGNKSTTGASPSLPPPSPPVRQPRIVHWLHNHADPISDVSTNARETVIASCDKAGFVSVQGVPSPSPASMMRQGGGGGGGRSHGSIPSGGGNEPPEVVAELWKRDMEVPLQTVAVHPYYEHMDEEPLMCAGADRVYLVTRLILTHRRATLVDEKRGKVALMRWSAAGAGAVVCWLTDRALCVYSYRDRVLLRALASPLTTASPAAASGSLNNGTAAAAAAMRFDLYPPTLFWESNVVSAEAAAAAATAPAGGGGGVDSGGAAKVQDTVVCGWGDWLQQVRVREVPLPKGASQQHQQQYQHSAATALATSPAAASMPRQERQRHHFVTNQSTIYRVESYTTAALRPSAAGNPFRVCGVAPFGPDHYLILACIIDGDGSNTNHNSSVSNAGTRPREGVMRDLEVRVVHRLSMRDHYRGRMMVRYAHPLQLGLTCHYGGEAGAQEQQQRPLPPPPAVGTEGGVQFPPADAVYYIVSADSVIQAAPCTEDDHVDFLLQCERYEEAYAYALRHDDGHLHNHQHHKQQRPSLLRRHSAGRIGQRMLQAMLAADGDHTTKSNTNITKPTASGGIAESPSPSDRVVGLLPSCVAPTDSASWERWIFVFDQRGESWKLSRALPTREALSAAAKLDAFGSSRSNVNNISSNTKQQPPGTATAAAAPQAIGKEYYDLVLLRTLEHDAVLFNAAVRRYDGLYTLAVVARAAEMQYRGYSSRMLLETPPMSAPLSPQAVRSGDLEELERRRSSSRLSRNVPSTEDNSNSNINPLNSNSANSITTATEEDDDNEDEAAADAAAGLTPEQRSAKAVSEAYGRLLCLQGRHDDALQVLLRLRNSGELFRFVDTAGIFQTALDLLPKLFARSRSRTLRLLLSHAPQAQPPSTVASPNAASPSPPRGGGGGGVPGPFPSSPNTATTTTPSTPPPASAITPRDPLSPESVVARLEFTDRGCLWLYLRALRRANSPAFTAVAKRHTQLVATLFIDFDRPQLLPFLKEMSMFLDRVKEIYALCRKHGLLDEVVFLMARMGKEEEGLRVIVAQMNNMAKAVRYVADAPAREEQFGLYRRLVQLAIDVNAQLPLMTTTTGDIDKSTHGGGGGGDFARIRSGSSNSVGSGGSGAAEGQRYVSHETQGGETYAFIAARYGVSEDVIRAANTSGGGDGDSCGGGCSLDQPLGSPGRSRGGANLWRYATSSSPSAAGGGGGGSKGPGPGGDLASAASLTDPAVASILFPTATTTAVPPRPCIVPVNLLSALLTATADPAYADNPAIDATHLIRSLPEGESIPSAGAAIAAVTRSRADEEGFLRTILQASEMDLAGDYCGLLRRRAAAIRIDPRAGKGRLPPPTPTPTQQPSSPPPAPVLSGGWFDRKLGASPRRGAGLAVAGQGGGGGGDTTTATAATPSKQQQRTQTVECGLCGQRVPSAAASTCRNRSSSSSSSTARSGPSAQQQQQLADEVGGLVVFACHHVYHPTCIVAFLAAEGSLVPGTDPSAVSLAAFFAHPEAYCSGGGGAKVINTSFVTYGVASSRLPGAGSGSGGSMASAAAAAAASRRRMGPHCRLCAVGSGGGTYAALK